MKDISNETKIKMFPELLSARFNAFNRCDYEDVSDIYNILRDYGFNYEETYFLLDNIIESVTGFNIKNYKTSREYEYKVPLTDGRTLFIDLTTDGDMWHGTVEVDEEIVFDSYVELFDWERESTEDMNTSRLKDLFELAEADDNYWYCWDDIEGIL